MYNEADTCRKYVLPKLTDSGWDTDPHSFTEQRTFTDGRIVISGNKVHRKKQKRADYLLRFTRDYPIAIVEAKAEYKTPSAGLGQAKEYAQILDLKFAYSTNGHGIFEFNFLTGIETQIDSFPTPDDLWNRLCKSKNTLPEIAQKILTPNYILTGKTQRYYQEVAINRILEAILNGKKRILITMATGTGKTFVAFQICWKLWSSRWNRTGEYRKPKILYLTDRNILVDDPKDKTFIPFGDARHKIENGEAVKSREMYFAIYQAIAKDERRPGLYKEYSPDFFDLVIVDECHRGSAKDESNWREILEYFKPAYQIGMTATPLREDNRDTYKYFGNPIYTYSLGQGIDDGFLAPYRVHRIITDYDAAGWRPSKDELDRYGRLIPDEEYQTKDFERIVALRARTQAIAKHITEFLKKDGRFGKTIVFCVDQEHAEEMRHAINNLNSDLVSKFPDYVCRVTSEEGDIGRGHLGRFQELETESPVILTTSKLLTTGVDIPTCRNIAIARVVGSMTEFKQIIGRGTRVRDDYGKYFFNILDYTGSATRHFADPDFDGYPAFITEQQIDKDGQVTSEEVIEPEKVESDEEGEIVLTGQPEILEPTAEPVLRKYYVDGGHVEIAAHLVYELDSDGNKLNVIKYTDYTGQKVRTLYPSAAQLREKWSDPEKRSEIIESLNQRGIDFEHLAEASGQKDADPFDLLCHIAYNAPLRTRRERATRLQSERKDFFEQYSPQAKEILNELLEKYAEHGTSEFTLPDCLQIPPINRHGNVIEIAAMFGGEDKLRNAVKQLQSLLYAA